MIKTNLIPVSNPWCEASFWKRRLFYLKIACKEAWSKTSSSVGGVKLFVNKRWMVNRTVMIRCALESPYLGQLFKHLEPYHIIHRKFFRATWSWKMPKKRTKTQKFRKSQLALKNKIWSFARFSTLGGSKKFSMGDMVTFDVFKRLP